MKGRCTGNYLLHPFENPAGNLATTSSDPSASQNPGLHHCTRNLSLETELGSWGGHTTALIPLAPHPTTSPGHRSRDKHVSHSSGHRQQHRSPTETILARARLGGEPVLAQVYGLPLIHPSEHPSLIHPPSENPWRGCHLQQTPPWQLPFLPAIKNGSTALHLAHLICCM